jgi:hypothetical protein
MNRPEFVTVCALGARIYRQYLNRHEAVTASGQKRAFF